jgi:hypothetical protein
VSKAVKLLFFTRTKTFKTSGGLSYAYNCTYRQKMPGKYGATISINNKKCTAPP